jgi:hypothetical protein
VSWVEERQQLDRQKEVEELWFPRLSGYLYFLGSLHRSSYEFPIRIKLPQFDLIRNALYLYSIGLGLIVARA